MVKSLQENICQNEKSKFARDEKTKEVDILKNRLNQMKVDCRRKDEILQQIRRDLESRFNRIQNVFDSVKPKRKQQLLSLPKSNRVNLQNYFEFLSAIEEKLRLLIAFVYENQEKTKDGFTTVIHGLEIVNRSMEAEELPQINLECIECAQVEDLNNRELEQLRNRQDTTLKIQRKIVEANQLFHIHDIDECKSSTSRALLSKRV